MALSIRSHLFLVHLPLLETPDAKSYPSQTPWLHEFWMGVRSAQGDLKSGNKVKDLYPLLLTVTNMGQSARRILETPRFPIALLNL